MQDNHVSGVYRPEDDARLELPRSIEQIYREVKEFSEQKKRRKLRIRRQWPFTQSYDSRGDLDSARRTYRLVGEKHPIDEGTEAKAPEPAVSERRVGELIDAIDRLRPSRVSLVNRMEYVLSKVSPPLTPQEWRLYKERIGRRYAKRRVERREENKAAWAAWLKAAS